MRIGYFDCFSGAAGDMILAAMISAGLAEEALRADLSKLKLPKFDLEIRRVNKQGFAAVKVDVRVAEERGHRHLPQILELIDRCDLVPRIKERARGVFSRLAEAEAKVHGTTQDKVHFHEVGAVDAIVDVVGAAIGIERLGLEQIVSSPIPTGNGSVSCQHGVMPVPAPATAELLVGAPLAACEEPGELTTPTGAAILTSLAVSYGGPPAMRLDRIGYGAGTREGKTRPNLLRLLIGESIEAGGFQDEVLILEANLDDSTGEVVGHAAEALFGAGALDVFTTAIAMKKGRPGVLLSVIVAPEKAEACEEVLFGQTTTFGVRRHRCTRRKLERSIETVATRYGKVRMKIGRRADKLVMASPEYEDCAAVARENGVSLREVMFEAETCWRTSQGRL